MNATSLPSSTRLLFDELLRRGNMRLRIGEHVVDVGALRLITRPAHPRLTSKAVAVLIELARHAGNTITRDQLLDRVWADRVTTPDVLTQAITELRRAFADDAKPSRYIETIPRVGYRLLAPVKVIGNEVSIISERTPLTQAENDPEPDVVAAESSPAKASKPHLGLRAVTALVALCALILVLGFWLYRLSVPNGMKSEWTVSDALVVTSESGTERWPAVSPDGSRAAYSQLDPGSGVDRVWIRVIGESKSILLTGKSTGFEEMSAWSPNGIQIAFERLDEGARCTLFIASIVGGAEREVGACGDPATNYFDWTPDSKGLITADHLDGTSTGMTLVRWDLETGKKQPLHYTRASDDQDLEAHYSPDGKTIAFRRGFAPYSDLYVMPAAGGEVRQLTHLASRIYGLAWTADGSGVVFSSGYEGLPTLYTADLSNGRLHALNVGPATYPASARAADTVTYEIPRSVSRLAQIALGGDKSIPEFLANSTGNDGSPALSPGGDRIAFTSNRNGSQQIWVYDFASNAASVVTEFHDAVLINPAWSDDGKRVLVTVRDSQAARLVEIDLATRRERSISKPGEKILSAEYGPDANSYLFIVGMSPAQNELVLMEHADEPTEKRTVLVRGVDHAQLDKTAHRVYYTRNNGRGLFARDLSGNDTERLVTASIAFSTESGWRIVDGHIWSFSKVDMNPTDIVEFDPATGKSRVLGHLNVEVHDPKFSVAPSRDRIYFVPLGNEDKNVGSFHLSRGVSR